MNILIFGATGMVGQQLVNHAIAHGHNVRAFGRNVYEEFSTERKYLELFKGYLFSEDDIKKALKGMDAVLSAIGGAVDGTDRARSLGMKKIVEVMVRKGPKRIVAIGGMGVLNANEEQLIFQTPDFPLKYKPVSMEHYEAYQHLAHSSLEWTFVCPPDIKDGPATEAYNLRADYPAEGLSEISAGDLADFMVRELQGRHFLQHRVGIAAKG